MNAAVFSVCSFLLCSASSSGEGFSTVNGTASVLDPVAASRRD